MSGNQAIFISNDYMRQHKFALNDAKLTILFKKWQHSHQYTYYINIAGKVKLQLLSGSFKDPQHAINSGVEKTGDFWHLPFLEHWHTVRSNVKAPKQWACFKVPDSYGLVNEPR